MRPRRFFRVGLVALMRSSTLMSVSTPPRSPSIALSESMAAMSSGFAPAFLRVSGDCFLGTASPGCCFGCFGSLLVLLPALLALNCCFVAAIYPSFPANAPRALARAKRRIWQICWGVFPGRHCQNQVVEQIKKCRSILSPCDGAAEMA